MKSIFRIFTTRHLIMILRTGCVSQDQPLAQSQDSKIGSRKVMAIYTSLVYKLNTMTKQGSVTNCTQHFKINSCIHGIND